MNSYHNISKHKEEIDVKKTVFIYGAILLLLITAIILLPAKVFIFIPLLILHILISFGRKNIIPSWFGIELILFSTVVAGILFGSLVGMITAVTFVLINYLFSEKYVKYVFMTLPLYILIGIFSAAIPLNQLVMWGILIAVGYAIVSSMLSAALGAKGFGLFMFLLTNIAFNIFLFLRFGPLIIGWMG